MSLSLFNQTFTGDQLGAMLAAETDAAAGVLAPVELSQHNRLWFCKRHAFEVGELRTRGVPAAVADATRSPSQLELAETADGKETLRTPVATATYPTDALNRAIAKFDKDSLRRFLVFATGSPSLPPESRDFEMQVRAMPRSNSLPVAHTCFFHVDIPEYASEEEFITKLMTAIHECGSFDRV